MASSRFAYRNWAWEAGVTITASASASGYPATNLSSPAPWKRWRSTQTTGDQWVKFDLGTARAMTACLLRGPLVHAGGSIRFQANATDSWGAPTIDTAFTIPTTMRTQVLALFFASQSLRWVRIYFTNTSAVDQAVELGVAFPTSALMLSRNIAQGVGFARNDRSVVIEATGGQTQVDQRAQQYALSVDPNLMQPPDRDLFFGVMDTVGTFLPWFMVIDDTDPNQIVYGRIEGGLQGQHVVGDLWAAPFAFKEEI